MDNQTYNADAIEVLEGLEPVRRRPGMYIGGTDVSALHHLVAEILDNAMDEAVAGHANHIELSLEANGYVIIKDNGRGIPIDKHPKFPDRSALEVILTTLHSGGKFSQGAYETAGGLHGVGISVVNALASDLTIEVARSRELWRQCYSRGKALTPLEKISDNVNRRGTLVRFKPDNEIFGNLQFQPLRLFKMARSKAYLFKGVEIRWNCDEALCKEQDGIPTKTIFHFPGGLKDYLEQQRQSRPLITQNIFNGQAEIEGLGRMEWAMAWPQDGVGFSQSYCNTIPTPQGGVHEAALRSILGRGLRHYGELTGNKQAKDISGEDVTGDAMIMLSVFIKEPQFQGQTKEKLTSPLAGRLVESVLKDRFDHWLVEDPNGAGKLLDYVIAKMQERLKRRQQKETARASATKKLPLPGKLADCRQRATKDTEIFLVEGDSAGGSAKQARNRDNQAVLPLKGKILNVASASHDKLLQNQEIKDLLQALGCGTRKEFNLEQLRYQRIIIMTDADVDGAHIAALLMTFFYYEMPQLILAGRLFLACPPLYRLSLGKESCYASDEEDKNQLLQTRFKGSQKVEINRFKGLGEMMPQQLRDTTMDPNKRRLLRVNMPDIHHPEQQLEAKETDGLFQTLMGKKPELRFTYIQENAKFIESLDI